MFTRIQASNYRCLRYIDQPVKRFETLVGPNASGKTTFLDVVAFMGDLMRNGGKVSDAVRERSADFRNLTWRGESTSFRLAVEAELPDLVRSQMNEDQKKFSSLRYELEIGIDDEENLIVLNHEALWLLDKKEKADSKQRVLFPESQNEPEKFFLKSAKGRKVLISNNPERNANFYFDGKRTYVPSFQLGRETAALANIPADKESYIAAPWFRDLLVNGIQNLTLNSQRIRQPSPPGLGKQFQPDGANLPWVVQELKRDPNRFDQWIEHVRTALPDISDIDSIERPEDRHRYLTILYKSGATVPSWLASDGTLRLLALTITAYLRDIHGVFLIEEPENGIHPQAIEAVLDSLSSIYEGQVLVATHSPVALNMLDPDQVLCFAKDSDGATDIVAGNNHPALRNWKAGEPDFGVLFAAGILS